METSTTMELDVKTAIDILGPLGPFVVVYLIALRTGHIESPAKRKEARESYDKVLVDMAKSVQDLYNMHNVKDAEGVPIWYVRKSLEDSVVSLITVVGDLKDAFQEFSTETRLTREIMQKLLDDH